jgi:hypothetical protein
VIIEQLPVMKKIAVIFLIIGLMVVSAYVYVNYSLNTPGFTPAQAKDTTVQAKPSESFLDLKPKLIEKLQQLVKQGSNGLYNLFIHELKPNILNSTVRISNASLVPDTAAMKELEQSKNLPDEIFKIKADSIWIDGLGIKDILSKDVIDVKTIHILQPTIDVYSKKHSYNQGSSPKTLYQRLMNQMRHIGIGKVIIEKGTLISHHPENKPNTRFNDIAINLTNIVIDSTTQFDENRFLFAKDAQLTMKNYAVPTSNNLYSFKIGVISVAATKQLLVAKNITLEPHFSKSEFQKHIKTQLERYVVSIPSIEFRNTNWWNLINNEELQADFAEINNVDLSVYLDRRLPSDGGMRKSFPHQLIMKIPLKLNIKKIKVNNLDLTYEEFSTLSNRTSTIYIDNLQGTISNLTNLPQVIKRNKTTTVISSGIFMHVAPAQLTLHLDLSNYKSGAFSADFKSTKVFDGTIVNSISEPSGLFMVKRGKLKELVAHITGNNYKASGDVLMLYNNLHITPMKKDPQNPDELKKKSVTSLIANSLVLKDENPSKNGDVRKENASFTRKSGTFFNLVWKTIFVGILKTIGAPEKLAYD